MYSTQEQSTTAPATDELRVALTLPAPDGGAGPTKRAFPLSASTLHAIRPDPAAVIRAVNELTKRGFRVSTQGRLSVSLRAKRANFEHTFGTQLQEFSVASAGAQLSSVLFPPDNAPWAPDPAVAALIDDCYIQWPHIYMSNRFAGPPAEAPTPPLGNAADFHLGLADVVMLLNADKAHRAGTTGKGVRVAMVDTGFSHSHAYFAERGYNVETILAPGAKFKEQDGNGHGTGESANLLAIAPDVTFIGVKLESEDGSPGASMLEGIQEALKHRPQVLSLSLGYDLCSRVTNQPFAVIPNNLKALEAEIQAAVAAGVIVVFSAGNGHVSFPGMMPEVLSAGGVHIAGDGRMQASNYASAFRSLPYPTRHVPDVCGLVGMQPHAPYIMLPVPRGCKIDRENAVFDGTTANDGWAAFSGTSAAAPQLAGVCALLLQKNPGLTADDIRAILRLTARDVQNGAANPASNVPNPAGMLAGPGIDDATGAGLVDAFAAWQQA